MRACVDQLRQDEVREVHWSRHLLACLARITGARGLIGCRSVKFHAHFWWYSSPTAGDEALGAVRDWPAESGILLLDAYPPPDRKGLLRRAAGHARHIWVLRMIGRDEASSADLEALVSLGAQLYARLSKRSFVTHVRNCWCEAKYDAQPAKGTAEVWRLGRANLEEFYLSPHAFKEALGDWEQLREDFHWPAENRPPSWDHYRAGQQDYVQESWEGLVAAIDGSVDRAREAMGAGVVVGKDLIPELSLAFPVGGPLASLRAEAAALDALVTRVPDDRPLLVFVDCLVLLSILAHWGQEDFWPDMDEIKHFDIIEPCLRRLRRRRATTRLVKVKSHSGILMNERADALADIGCASDDEPSWPGPRKSDPLQLCPRDSIRKAYAPFPDRFVCDKQLIKRASEGVERDAGRARGTIFSREILQDPVNCHAILSAISSQPDSLVRLWMQTVSGLYPTMARLHRILPGKFRSATCTWCNANVPETLCHFASTCTKFHHARTEAHNRAWQIIAGDLRRAAPPGWRFHIETAVRDTGLLCDVLRGGTGQVAPAGGPILDLECFNNLRPDAIAVNLALKKIAIIDLTRPYDGCDERGRQPDVETLGEAVAPNSDEHDRLRFPSERKDDTQDSNGRSKMLMAAKRKMDKYADLAWAIRQGQGTPDWQVQVFPWVVGVRGVIDTAGISRALEFLEVPTKRRWKIQQRTALASVKSFEFLHRVRTSANPRRIPFVSGLSEVATSGRKRQRNGEEAVCTLQRWKRLSGDTMRINLLRARWRGSGEAGS